MTADTPPSEVDYAGLVSALRGHWQIDEDGTNCGVSRQAVCEAADIIAALAPPNAAIPSAEPVVLPPDDEPSRMTIHMREVSDNRLTYEQCRRVIEALWWMFEEDSEELSDDQYKVDPRAVFKLLGEGYPVFLAATNVQSGDSGVREALDAARYRWLKEQRSTLLLTGFFGNGCINRTMPEVEAEIDAAIEREERGARPSAAKVEEARNEAFEVWWKTVREQDTLNHEERFAAREGWFAALAHREAQSREEREKKA